MLFLLLLALGIGAWLALTWWNTPEEHTFKNVCQDALKDAREICAPAICYGRRFWIWFAPKATNPTTWAALAVNAALYWPSFAADPMVQAFLSRHPVLYLAGAFVAFIATRANGAPHRLPPAYTSPSGGLTNDAALRAST